MEAFDITDPLLLEALAAMDSGKTAELINMIDNHPRLVKERLLNGEEGYFKDPYLLWFVADNPIRTGKLPGNIVEITRGLVHAVKREALDTYQYQIDYALCLVASGNTTHVCGVQIAMIDLLLDAGASPDCGMEALTNGNLEAAQYLIDRGAQLTLALAVCLHLTDDINNLITLASPGEKIAALAAAAYYGKADVIEYLLNKDIDPNGFPDRGSGFHSHATALHQAVSSGSLPCVKLLVEAGAKLDVQDKIYEGTPLGWADYLGRDADGEEMKGNLSLIESYLRSCQ